MVRVVIAVFRNIQIMETRLFGFLAIGPTHLPRNLFALRGDICGRLLASVSQC
jgi:hypothetical protein